MTTTANAFGSTFAFLSIHKANAKNAKELQSQRAEIQTIINEKQKPRKTPAVKKGSNPLS